MPAQEERAVLGEQLQSAGAALLERQVDVRSLHEPEARGHRIHLGHQHFNAHAIGRVLARGARDIHVQEHDALVRDVIVLEIAHQRSRHVLRIAGQEHRRTGYACDTLQQLGQLRQRYRHRPQRAAQQPPAAAPDHEHTEHQQRQRQWHPGAFGELGHVADEVHQVDAHQRPEHAGNLPAMPAPLRHRQLHAEQRGDEHGSGDRGAIGGAQRGRAAECQHEKAHCDEHEPVHHRDVDLAVLVRRGLLDAQPRQQVELDALTRDRKGTGNGRLRGNDRGRGRQQHHQRQHGPGHQLVERQMPRGRIAQNERPLAEIIQHQRRPHQREPRYPHRLLAEVTHVRIQRFAAGHRQEHSTEDPERQARSANQQQQRKGRAHRNQHRWILQQRRQSGHGQHQEPHQHDRTEQAADPLRATALNRKQRDNDHQRHRHHGAAGVGTQDLQPLHRAQHRDCGRDQCIAVEQRRAKRCQHDDHALPAVAGSQRALHQREQRQDSALALVVGTHDQHHILERDHQQQAPEDQRQHSQYRQAVGGRSGGGERRLERIQRAGADISIDHAHRANDGRPRQARCFHARFPARRGGRALRLGGHSIEPRHFPAPQRQA